MKGAVPILGLLLIAFGVLGLAFGGFSYFYNDSFDMGPFSATYEREKEVPITPLAGGVAIAAGVGLLLWSSSSNKK